jgi:hypothetical protein
MSDIRSVEIVIRQKGSSSKNTATAEQAAYDPSSEIDMVSPDASYSSFDEFKKVVNYTIAGVSIKNTAENIVKRTDYAITRYFKLNDDYIGQRNYNDAKNVLGKIASTAAFAASATAVFGPIGGIVSIVSSVVSTGVDIIGNYVQTYDEMNKVNAQLSFTRVRAGYSLTAGSTGEDR